MALILKWNLEDFQLPFKTYSGTYSVQVSWVDITDHKCNRNFGKLSLVCECLSVFF